jgi:hypothetical protein
MTEAETVTKESVIELTTDQQMIASKIIDKFVDRTVVAIAEIEKPVAAVLRKNVEMVCDDLANAGIPKQLISNLVCQKADNFNRTSDYIRRLIPAEFKDQVQRNIRLSKIHEGGNHSHQHEIQVNSGDDIEFTKPSPSPNTKTKSHSISKREYDALKTEVESLRTENDDLKKKLEDTLDVNALCAFASEESDEELGRKVRIMVEYDPRYKAYLKKEKARAKAKAKITKDKKNKELEKK